MQVRMLALLLALTASSLWGCKTLNSAETPVYRVRMESGDTLASVAAKYDTTWGKIAKLNGIEPGQPVKVGTVLRIQPGPGGLVAGALTPAPSRRVSRKGSNGGGNVAPADASEFTEEDIPVDDAAAAARGKRKGLLFGGDDRASLTWPVHGEISSRFGMRNRRMHRGIDIRAPRGTEIVAAGRGVVEFAGRQNGYGKTVVIDHNGVKTLYAHLSSVKVLRGERVSAATVIGTVGSSGNASGPHLHFEVRNREEATVDPLGYLEERKLLSARR